MKLSLERHHQSLTPFSVELPDFTILTGFNGADKTQLLRAIQGEFVEIDAEKRTLLKLDRPEIVFIQSNSIDSIKSSTLSRIKLN